jgi:hypothetical protein
MKFRKFRNPSSLSLNYNSHSFNCHQVMSDDFEDPPLEFPNSDTEENSQDSTSDTEPVTSNKKHQWTSECIQLLVDHGLDPDSFEMMKKMRRRRRKTKQVNFQHILPANIPDPKFPLARMRILAACNTEKAAD